MDAGSPVEITDGVNSDTLTIASVPQWNQVLLSTDLPGRYVALDYDGEWSIHGLKPEQQRIYRIYFRSENYKKWKPDYPLGTVLVVTEYSGNATTTSYYSLVKKLASGNYKAHELAQVATAKYDEPGGTHTLAEVRPTDKIARANVDLKWYTSTKAFAAEKPTGRYTTVSNKIYNPNIPGTYEKFG